MKRALALIGVVLAAAGVAAAEAAPAATNSLALVLRDGSQVRGKTRLETLAIAGAYGELNVPLAQIRGMVIEQVSAKGETWQQVRLEMTNGDKLTGRPRAPKLDVETAYGTLSVPLADVVKIDLSPAGTAGGGGRILYYAFDDKADKVVDKSGHGHDGVVCGATWTPNGKVGGACEFDEKRYVDTGCNFSGMDEITVAGWVRPVKDARGASVATQFGSGAHNDVWGLFAQADSSLDLVPPHKSYASVVTAKDERLQLYGRPTGVGQWTHLCFTFKKQGQFVLYQNGVLVAQTAAGDAPLRKRDSTAKIGASLAGDGYWGFGTLDEIMIFDRALSADEVAGLCRAGGGQVSEKPCQRLITVPANASADAGEVVQGHRYTFEATGLVGINVGGPNGGPAHKADPDGHTISQMDGSVTDPQPADSRFPAPGLATHSLVGKIGGAACVPLGKGGSFIAPASGKLTLLCNDLIPGDNSGNWQVKISESSVGPVLNMTFDTDEGVKVSDKSGRGNHGAVVGARYTPQGKNGGGYCLSGTQEHITIPNSDSLEIRDAVTAAVWVNLASLGPGGYGNEHGYIINKGDDLWWNPAFCLGYAKSGQPLFHVGNATDPQRGGGKTALGETKIVPGQWVHLAGVYDGATVKLYVNGRLDREEKYSGQIRSDRAPVHLGGGKLFGVDWGNHFTVHGTIDEVMIFDRALSAGEVRQLCLGGGNP